MSTEQLINSILSKDIDIQGESLLNAAKIISTLVDVDNPNNLNNTMLNEMKEELKLNKTLLRFGELSNDVQQFINESSFSESDISHVQLLFDLLKLYISQCLMKPFANRVIAMEVTKAMAGE
jgi:hypothetical protein